MAEMRDDGSLPATKADLREFATKADLREFATKADMRTVIERLDGHDGNLRRLNISFARLEGDMTEVKGTLGVVVEDLSQVKNILERMNGNIETSLRKMELQGSMLMEREGRLTKLETRPS